MVSDYDSVGFNGAAVMMESQTDFVKWATTSECSRQWGQLHYT